MDNRVDKDQDLKVEERAIQAIEQIEEQTADLYNKLNVRETHLIGAEYYKKVNLQIKRELFLQFGVDERLLDLMFWNNSEGNFEFTIYTAKPERGSYSHLFQIYNVNVPVGLTDSSRREPFLATTFAPDESCPEPHWKAFNLLKELGTSKTRAIEEGFKNVTGLIKAVNASLS